jgi:outer membrane protein W
MRSAGIVAAISLGLGASVLPHESLADDSASQWLRGVEIRVRYVDLSAKSPVSSQFYPELSAEIFIARHVSTEFAIGNSQFNAECCDIDRSYRMRPFTWTVKYNVLLSQNVDPYLGFGLQHTDVSGPTGTHFSGFLYPGSSSGWAAQAGVDVRFSRSWVLNVDVRYLDNLKAGQFRADPFLIGFGVAYGPPMRPR